MTNRTLLILAMLAALICLLVTTGCQKAETQSVSKQITRTWIAVGTDGRLLIGQCAEYDLRYCLDDSMALVTNWQTCSRVAGLPAPKPAGQPESYTFTMTVQKDRAYWYSIKAKDSLGRWSPKSNCVREMYAADPPPAISTLE